MKTPGTIIDRKYTVIDALNSEGGMGVLLRVSQVGATSELALKYCLSKEPGLLDRFRREIRLMTEFAGNSKVVQIIDSNLAHDPPYFVMPIYPNGDLRTYRPGIESDHALQEVVMLGMAECVGELHRVNKFHRDIKPANFLRGADHDIVVSDLGLGMDLLSRTGFTQSNEWGGTQGYIPPEFLKPGGFKNATAQSDIFMLGKAFYNLLTDLDPQFIDRTTLPKPLFYLIDRCCQQDPGLRYQSVPELRQEIVAAFDMILGRLVPLGEAQLVYNEIGALLVKGRYKAESFKRFITVAASLDPLEVFSIVRDADSAFYFVLSQSQLRAELAKYLEIYKAAVLVDQRVGFSYAEHVADQMKVVFNTSDDSDLRAQALELAIEMAARMNRFAAMSTCSEMITGILAGDPAEASVAAVLQRNPQDFLASIERSSCKSPLIAEQIAKLATK